VTDAAHGAMSAEHTDPVLYVVDTPIGHLEDLTDRAKRILRSVPLIISEDTRRTRKLLSHLDTSTDLVSFHEHSEPDRLDERLNDVQRHGTAALVSDAGNPVVSDPGGELVRAAIRRDVRVIPIPGPSAVSAALSAAGERADRYLFAGYPPEDPEQLDAWLETLDTDFGPAVVFLPPHDLPDVLDVLSDRYPDRRLTIGRELTKQHEEVMHGTCAELRERIGEAEIRGEYTLVLAPVPSDREEVPHTEQPVEDEHLEVLLDADLRPTDAARVLAGLRDVDRGTAYDLLQEKKEERN